MGGFGGTFDLNSLLSDTDLDVSDRHGLMRLFSKSLNRNPNMEGSDMGESAVTSAADRGSAAATGVFAPTSAPAEKPDPGMSTSGTATTSRVGGKSQRQLELESELKKNMDRSPLLNRDRTSQDRKTAYLLQAMQLEQNGTNQDETLGLNREQLDFQKSEATKAKPKHGFAPVKTRKGTYASPVFDPNTGHTSMNDTGVEAPVEWKVNGGSLISEGPDGQPKATMFSPESIGAHGSVFQKPDGSFGVIPPRATPVAPGAGRRDDGVPAAVINGFNAAYQRGEQGEYLGALEDAGLYNRPTRRPSAGAPAPAAAPGAPATVAAAGAGNATPAPGNVDEIWERGPNGQLVNTTKRRR